MTASSLDHGVICAAMADAAIRAFSRYPGSRSGCDEDACWLRTPVESATFNHVFRLRLRAETDSRRVRELLDHFASPQVPVAWHLSPGPTPAALGALLDELGFAEQETEVGMAIDLSTADWRAPNSPGVRVDLVNDAVALDSWIEAMAAANDWEPNESRLTGYRRFYGAVDPLMLHFLATEGSEPVGAASLFLVGGGAWVTNISVVPSARRRGIGSMVTKTTLDAAADRGLRYAYLGASEMGAPLYRRLGFWDVCIFRRYVWPGSAPGG